MKSTIRTILSAIIIIFFGLISPAMALDDNLSGDYNKQFSVDLSPESPGAFTAVKATFSTHAFDENRAYITWILDGAKKLEGRGQKEFTFKTGAIGKKMVLTVSATSDTGISNTKTFYIYPAEVDLIWEAQTYTPSSYKGKALPSTGSFIKVYAIPHLGADKKPSNLYYNWQLNYKNQPTQSGIGKNYFLFKTSELASDNTISVEVSDYNKTISAKNFVRIKNQNPKIIFYEERPLEGVIYSTVLSDKIVMSAKEIIIKAEPYFFSAKDLPRISYKWSMNSKSIEAGESPNVFSFLSPEGTSGTSFINLKIDNPLEMLQSAQKSFSIQFGTQ